jgi:hypothetical protein
MSQKHSIEVECPGCKATVNVTVWSSLNATLEPEAKSDLFQGKINHFQCPHCNHTAFLQASFLYHDMEHKFCVHYFPFESLEEEGFFENFLPNGKLNFSLPDDKLPRTGYMKDTHIVFSMIELIQYVIFRDKLREAKRSS